MDKFGKLLHLVRSRQKASQLVNQVGISYAYLLDIEKGARTAPKEDLLLALAERLDFKEGEKELFFDLAAKERNSIPADVSQYLFEHKETIDVIRAINKSNIELEYLNRIREITLEANDNG